MDAGFNITSPARPSQKGHRGATSRVLYPTRSYSSNLWNDVGAVDHQQVLLDYNGLIAGLECLVFGDHFNDDIGGVVWPEGLEKLKLGRALTRMSVMFFGLHRCSIRGLELGSTR